MTAVGIAAVNVAAVAFATPTALGQCVRKHPRTSHLSGSMEVRRVAGQTQKPRSIGTRLCQIRMELRYANICEAFWALVETYGLRYARPDPERRADAICPPRNPFYSDIVTAGLSRA